MCITTHYHQRELYLSAAQRYALTDRWDVSLSADYQMNALTADLVDFVYPRRHTGLVAAATSLRVGRGDLQASVLGTFATELVKSGSASAVDRH